MSLTIESIETIPICACPCRSRTRAATTRCAIDARSSPASGRPTGSSARPTTPTRTSRSSPRSWRSCTTSSPPWSSVSTRSRPSGSGRRCCRSPSTSSGPRWYAMQAIACVDTAVWDAVGKALGQPLWRLWGGYRDRMPMIGIGGYYIPDDERPKGQEIEREIDFFQARARHGRDEVQDRRRGRPPRTPRGSRVRAATPATTSCSSSTRTRATRSARRWSSWPLIRADGIELRWFEEPTRWHADFRGLRDVRCAATSMSPPARARSAASACAR